MANSALTLTLPTTPVPVSQGGTAASSLTAYAVMCGGTTSTGAVQSVASVGTSGHVLTSNGAGALPTFQAASSGTAATQADQEAATSTSTYVSPGRQQYHPSATKAWVTFTSVTTTTINASFNVTSLTDNGTGDTTINFTNNFSSGNYAVAGMSNKSSDSGSGQTTVCLYTSGAKAAGTVRVQTTYGGGSPALIDLADTNVTLFGDQ